MKLDMELVKRVAFLDREWWALCRRLCVKDTDLIKSTFSMLVGRYSEQHRHYHDLSHVENCLKEFQEVQHFCVFPNAVEMALWFHDAVYDIRRGDNEHKSAMLAANSSLDMWLGPYFSLRVYNLILPTDHKILPKDIKMYHMMNDMALVVDIDLSSLGASPEVFDENTEKIFLEYRDGGGLSREAFNAGRVSWIKTMLPPNRPYIYSTDYFKTKYEAQAQKNLKRALEKLKT